MLVHQTGAFLGIALGGWLAEHTGHDTLLWLIDIGLALAAAALVWPRPFRLRADAAMPAAAPSR